VLIYKRLYEITRDMNPLPEEQDFKTAGQEHTDVVVVIVIPIQEYNRIFHSRKGLYFIQQAILSACMTYYLILHVTSESTGCVDFQLLVFGRKGFKWLFSKFFGSN